MSQTSAAPVTGRRVVFVYRALRGDQAVRSASVAATVAIMQERATALGEPSAVQATGADQIILEVGVPGNFPDTGSLSGKVQFPDPLAAKTGQSALLRLGAQCHRSGREAGAWGGERDRWSTSGFLGLRPA